MLCCPVLNIKVQPSVNHLAKTQSTVLVSIPAFDVPLALQLVFDSMLVRETF